MQPIRRGNDELPFEMVDHGMTTLFVSGVHMNFWRVHLLYFTIPSKTQNSVILKLSLFIHMDCQKGRVHKLFFIHTLNTEISVYVLKPAYTHMFH